MSTTLEGQRISDDAFRHMQRLFIERTHPLYLRYDREMCLADWWGDADYYGFEPLQIGAEADTQVDFLVGVTVDDELDLPIVQTPNGQPVSIHVHPESGFLCVLILDAAKEHARQTEIQQKSNEVQLLSKRQQQLMEELRATQIEVDRKRREAEAANRLKSEFISSMSHEFRTPLTSVLGYTELLSKTLQTERSELDKLSAISRGAKHLLSLIENLLDHGRLEGGSIVMQSRPMDIHALAADLRAIFSPLAEKKNLDFEIVLKNVPEIGVEIDDMRYRQVLINLIGNAIKFTQTGFVKADIEWRSNQLFNTVTDSGPGIPDAAKERVFMAFQRAGEHEESGAGLGLAISKSIVDMMGGELQIVSTGPTGSSFHFAVPADRREATPAADAPSELTMSSGESAPDTSGGTVLLAEDDDDIANLIEFVLEDAGYEVLRAHNGQEAIDIARERMPAMLLMDMNMPVVNGIDAVRQLREGGFDNPVVALTASASAEYRTSAMAAGCNDYLVKPVDMATLLSAVAVAIDPA